MSGNFTEWSLSPSNYILGGAHEKGGKDLFSKLYFSKKEF